jgi:opacity protein-like surface antigen
MFCHGLERASWLCLLFTVGLLLADRDALAEQSYFAPGSMQLTVYGGSFDSNPEAQFVGIRNEYSLGVIFGYDLPNVSYVGLDMELLGANRDIDTTILPPIFGTLDNDTTVETVGLLFGGRVYYPVTRAIRVYGVGGLGYYRTNLRVTGTLMGFPGVYEEDDTSFEFYYGAGLSYEFETWSLGFHYRHINLNGDFGSFQISDAELGGDLLALGVGFRF